MARRHARRAAVRGPGAAARGRRPRVGRAHGRAARRRDRAPPAAGRGKSACRTQRSRERMVCRRAVPRRYRGRLGPGCAAAGQRGVRAPLRPHVHPLRHRPRAGRGAERAHAAAHERRHDRARGHRARAAPDHAAAARETAPGGRMTGITSHVLDLSSGKPAPGVAVTLEHIDDKKGWHAVAQATTDADGRVKDAFTKLHGPGHYRLTFATGAYFAARNVACFHPEVTVVFEVRDDTAHHHVPLLLSPFGYSTYRGS